jgi:hypothetical protein
LLISLPREPSRYWFSDFVIVSQPQFSFYRSPASLHGPDPDSAPVASNLANRSLSPTLICGFVLVSSGRFLADSLSHAGSRSCSRTRARQANPIPAWWPLLVRSTSVLDPRAGCRSRVLCAVVGSGLSRFWPARSQGFIPAPEIFDRDNLPAPAISVPTESVPVSDSPSAPGAKLAPVSALAFVFFFMRRIGPGLWPFSRPSCSVIPLLLFVDMF